MSIKFINLNILVGVKLHMKANIKMVRDLEDGIFGLKRIMEIRILN